MWPGLQGEGESFARRGGDGISALGLRTDRRVRLFLRRLSGEVLCSLWRVENDPGRGQGEERQKASDRQRSRGFSVFLIDRKLLVAYCRKVNARRSQTSIDGTEAGLGHGSLRQSRLMASSCTPSSRTTLPAKRSLGSV